MIFNFFYTQKNPYSGYSSAKLQPITGTFSYPNLVINKSEIAFGSSSHPKNVFSSIATAALTSVLNCSCETALATIVFSPDWQSAQLKYTWRKYTRMHPFYHSLQGRTTNHFSKKTL